MLVFVLGFGLAYVAVTLLASGLSHLIGFSAFRALVRTHGILSPSWALPVAAGVAVYEVVTGALAASLLIAPQVRMFAALVFVTNVLIGCGFWLYVRRLLSRPVRAASCGCSPVSSRITPASPTPALSLVMVSLAGFAATAIRSAHPVPRGVVLLSILWGATLAGLIMLFPAVVPAAVEGGDEW